MRSPVFFISATLESKPARASSGIGSSTTISPVVAAAAESSARTSSRPINPVVRTPSATMAAPVKVRSEEHTSELQSRFDLVCRLLLEKNKETGHVHAAHG